MTETIWMMTSADEDLARLPEPIRQLLLDAERLGFSDFWYHSDYGLYATAPNAVLEDDRIRLERGCEYAGVGTIP